jgi:hypothetical protein
MAFKIKVEPAAIQDIQNEINYYNDKQKGLGKRLHTEIKNYFLTLKTNPFYALRYDNVHCLPLKKFPVMIHYTIDELKKRIIVRAVINTHKDPKEYWIK